MIEIRDITKTYKTGDLVQRALDGVSVTFRESEFVAVLGPSGSHVRLNAGNVGTKSEYDITWIGCA